MDTLIDCFENNVDSCLKEKKDVQIQKVDINKLFSLAIDKLNKTKERLTKTLASPLKKIINSVGEFGLCVKGECSKLLKYPTTQPSNYPTIQVMITIDCQIALSTKTPMDTASTRNSVSHSLRRKRPEVPWKRAVRSSTSRRRGANFVSALWRRASSKSTSPTNCSITFSRELNQYCPLLKTIGSRRRGGSGKNSER